MNNADVIVVGAGLAGLAMAASLAHLDIDIVILERGPCPQPLPEQRGRDLTDWDGRVSALTPASQRILEHIGAWRHIPATRMAPFRHMRVWDSEGTGDIDFHAAEVDADSLGAIVENRETIAALLQIVAAQPRVQLHYNSVVAALEQSEDAVVLTTQAGNAYRGSLVIGADGARSRVRELGGFKTRQWSYNQHAIVGTIAIEPGHEDTCWQAFLGTGPLALLPLNDSQLCSIVWSLDDDAYATWADCDDASFVRGLNNALGSRGPTVVSCGPRAVFPLHQCHATDYARGSLVLIADAAHSIHPLAGQGINLGLADVEALAECLGQNAAAGLSANAAWALKKYQRIRKGDNLAMMAAMQAFKVGFGSQQPWLRVLRNTALSRVNHSQSLKQWFTLQALGR
jgi:2-octaprenylphenol hydroxylase